MAGFDAYHEFVHALSAFPGHDHPTNMPGPGPGSAALRDALRVAESWGDRLHRPGFEGDAVSLAVRAVIDREVAR
jgi:hypothetical protein